MSNAAPILADFTARDLTLSGIVGLAITLIFMGALVPYRLVRRTDYERVMKLLEEAQKTNATNAETMKATASEKSLNAAVMEAVREAVGGVHHNQGGTQEEPT